MTGRAKPRPAKPAMQVHTAAHPGIEMDSMGHPIPVADRLAEDRVKLRRAAKSRTAKPASK